MPRQNSERPIALISSPAAFLSLPGARILHPFGGWLGYKEGTKWVGRVENIIVILPETNQKAEAILRLLASYEADSWTREKIDGMIIYTQ